MYCWKNKHFARKFFQQQIYFLFCVKFHQQMSNRFRIRKFALIYITFLKSYCKKLRYLFSARNENYLKHAKHEIPSLWNCFCGVCCLSIFLPKKQKCTFSSPNLALVWPRDIKIERCKKKEPKNDGKLIVWKFACELKMVLKRIKNSLECFPAPNNWAKFVSIPSTKWFILIVDQKSEMKSRKIIFSTLELKKSYW